MIRWQRLANTFLCIGTTFIIVFHLMLEMMTVKGYVECKMVWKWHKNFKRHRWHSCGARSILDCCCFSWKYFMDQFWRGVEWEKWGRGGCTIECRSNWGAGKRNMEGWIMYGLDILEKHLSVIKWSVWAAAVMRRKGFEWGIITEDGGLPIGGGVKSWC